MMWKRQTTTLPQEMLTIDPALHTDKDLARVGAIFAKISTETERVFSALERGLVDDASFKTVEENLAKNFLLGEFAEIRREAIESMSNGASAVVRQEAYQDSINAARRFAAQCSKAAAAAGDVHPRTIAKCVAALFEQFAAQLEKQHLAG